MTSVYVWLGLINICMAKRLKTDASECLIIIIIIIIIEIHLEIDALHMEAELARFKEVVGVWHGVILMMMKPSV